MQSVHIQDFQKRLLYYLTQAEAISIHLNDRELGVYTPNQRTTPEQRQQTFENLDRALKQAMAESGMTEEQLADALSPNMLPLLQFQTK